MGIISIDRPAKRNALTVAMLSDLLDIVRSLVDDEVCAVVLTGGPEIFSAGVDLGELGAGPQDTRVDDVLASVADCFRALPVPVVAAIEGPCVGGAVEIALAADACVLGAEAFLSVPATSLGILYRPQALANLVSRYGYDAVARLFLFTHRVSAQEALHLRLVNQIHASGEALAGALSLCEGTDRASVAAVAATKALLVEVSSPDFEVTKWEDRRRALLASDERRVALERQRNRAGREL